MHISARLTKASFRFARVLLAILSSNGGKDAYPQQGVGPFYSADEGRDCSVRDNLRLFQFGRDELKTIIYSGAVKFELVYPISKIERVGDRAFFYGNHVREVNPGHSETRLPLYHVFEFEFQASGDVALVGDYSIPDGQPLESASKEKWQPTEPRRGGVYYKCRQ